MSNRTNLGLVFEECRERGILVDFASVCCCNSCNREKMQQELSKTPYAIGYIFCHGLSMLDMVEELAEEGSATIYFGFDGSDSIQRTAVGYAFASVLRANGYPVVWNESPDSKVGVVVNRYSLPEDFHEDMQECVTQFVTPERIDKILRLLEIGVTGPRTDYYILSDTSEETHTSQDEDEVHEDEDEDEVHEDEDEDEVHEDDVTEDENERSYATDETIELETLTDSASLISDDYLSSDEDSSIDLTTECPAGCTCVNCTDE